MSCRAIGCGSGSYSKGYVGKGLEIDIKDCALIYASIILVGTLINLYCQHSCRERKIEDRERSIEEIRIDRIRKERDAKVIDRSYAIVFIAFTIAFHIALEL